MPTLLRPARRCGPALALAACLAVATPARAAGSSADQAAAEALFAEAKQLAAAGDYEHACPKFVESQRLDPTAGTLLNIGNCYEKLGKLASAWGAFKEAEMVARNAGDTGRQGEAQRRAEALAPKLAKLAIVVPPAARVPGFEVRRDGSVIGEGQWGSSLPADTGRHTIEASAPGRKPWSTTVRIDVDGSAASVDVPVLELAPVGTPAGAPPPAFWNGQRIAGAAVGGAGLASLVVSSIFTARMRSKNQDSLSECRPNDPTKCTATGVNLRNQAFELSHVATATLIGGGVAVGAGLIVFFTAPRATVQKQAATASLTAIPILAPGSAGLAVQGAW